jgi:polar amino acid transport system substrate-binding protein
VHTFFLFFTSLLLLALPASASDPASPPLVVGMELAYPPFEMANPEGKPEGVSVDLATEMASALQRKLEIVNLPFDGLIPSLKTGKIDLIISSMTATPERARSIDFSQPYLSTGLCMLLSKNSDAQSITDVDQRGKVVAVKQGTTGHLFSRQLKNARVLVLDRENACVLEVVQGRADAFLYDQMSILKHYQQNPLTTRAQLLPFQSEFWAVGIRKGNEALKDKVNTFLTDFKAKGGFETLGERWLSSQKSAFKAAGSPFLF